MKEDLDRLRLGLRLYQEADHAQPRELRLPRRSQPPIYKKHVMRYHKVCSKCGTVHATIDVSGDGLPASMLAMEMQRRTLCPLCGGEVRTMAEGRYIDSDRTRVDEKLRERDGCIKAGAVLITLGLCALLLWYVLSPPSGAREARSRLDPAKYPNPADRIEGLNMIKGMTLNGSRMSGYQSVQEKGCRDPEPQVRVAALQVLAESAEGRPEFIKGSWGAVYVDTRFLTELGKTDPSAEVRIAVAEYWARADVLSEDGIEALQSMLDSEEDEKVSTSVKQALARRLERSLKDGTIDAQTANTIRGRYGMGE